MSSTTPQQIQNKGVTQIGNTILTPNILNKAKTNMGLKGKLFLDYKTSKKPFVQDKFQPVVGLSGTDLKTIDTSSFDEQIKTTDDFKQLIE